MDVTEKSSVEKGEVTSSPEHDHSAVTHKISPEDDARVRRKIDMVVLPMV